MTKLVGYLVPYFEEYSHVHVLGDRGISFIVVFLQGPSSCELPKSKYVDTSWYIHHQSNS